MLPNTTKRQSDERAVSPVIGVILMVAITVILAAVIGTFVMGIGQDASQSAPQVSLSVETETGVNNVTITHDGGDGLTDGDTKILITRENDSTTLTAPAGESDDTFTVGNKLRISTGTGNMNGSDVFTGRTGPGESLSDTFTVASGIQYTVKIIDTASQRTIFETTATA